MLSGTKNVSVPVTNYDEIQAKVEKLMHLPIESQADRERNDQVVVDTLRTLGAEIDSIQEQANGYPNSAIDAVVWLDGFRYAGLCKELTAHFAHANWLVRQENASALWKKATLAVCSHYHHMVGPAMLANADCHERLGNTEHAVQLYRAVISDFSFLLEDDFSDRQIDDDERVAIESLKTAAHRLVEMEAGGEEVTKLENIRAEAHIILS